MTRKRPYAHIFFIDGMGLGGRDPAVNPFVRAATPNLNTLLGDEWFVAGNGTVNSPRATLVPTDPNMGVAGRPQSATGQATILTGRNIPALVGEHFGPKPNPAVAALIGEGSLFQETIDSGRSAALLTPYPQGYFDAIDSGHRLYSAVPLAAVSAGLSLMTADDLQQGRAISPDFTAQGWRDFLGYDDIPVRDYQEAGRHIATLAAGYDFSFFEHWPSDRAGHRGTLDEARSHLEHLDAALGGLLDAWDDDTGLLIITSDHGNIEDKTHRRHTRNPVPTIVVGPDHEDLAAEITNLSDLAGIIRQFLSLPQPESIPVAADYIHE